MSREAEPPADLAGQQEREPADGRGALGPTRCARHPNVTTALRCPTCDTPICPRCLVHTPVGAKCPACARGPRIPGLELGPLTYVRSAAAGIGVGALGGMVMLLVPLGFLAFLGLLLIGLLVGEAVSAAARRRASRGLAILAFAATVVGPLLGAALVVALRVPIGDPGLRAAMALAVAIQWLGGFGLLLLLVAGVVASTRVSRGP